MTSFGKESVNPTQPPDISQCDGGLAVFCVGLGAISTTLMAGVDCIRRELASPVGSLSQLGTVRLGRRDTGTNVSVKSLVPLADLHDLHFCAWDPVPDNAYESAIEAGVLSAETLDEAAPFLREIRPLPAVFDQRFVREISGSNARRDSSLRDSVEGLRSDISNFMKSTNATRGVVIWTGSTESFLAVGPAHESIESFESALNRDDPSITPTMIYAYAALGSGLPFVNCSPNLGADIPALVSLANANHVAIAGKDLKTGQTMVKTALAPMLKARLLGINGWFSTNILGNRDGQVLQDPDSLRAKQLSKLGVLDSILQPALYPELYSDIEHQVTINYYPPRGDNKEGWDNIDIFGWLDYPMQLKVNFLCRDSILAAPLVLDSILFVDLAQRAKMWGVQEWLSFYFKNPHCSDQVYPEHDLFVQLMKLKNTLRFLGGEDPITHLGIEYYEYFT